MDRFALGEGVRSGVGPCGAPGRAWQPAADASIAGARALGERLYELRFELNRVAWRITYYFAGPGRRIVLTVFRKQRQNERAEVQRARAVMARCVAEGHTAEEDDG